MAKAHITTKDGTTINLEGTAEEVATLVAKFEITGKSAGHGQTTAPARTSKKAGAKKAKAKSGGKTGVQSILSEMIGDGDFKKPKLLGEVRAALEQGGHFYTRMSVSTALLRAVKAKELRRIKLKGKWAYVI
jgi:hypothetical protein